MKVTVMSVTEHLDYIAVGEIINFKKTPIALDEKQIIASYNGNDIGRVGATVTICVPGTETNKDIYDKVPDEFMGTVVDNQKTISTTTTMKVLVVDITGVSGGQSTSTKGSKIFTFECNGSSTKYPGKTETINDANSGRKVILSMRKEFNSKTQKEDIILYRQINGANVDCGIIAENKLGNGIISSHDDYEFIKNIIDNEKIEARVISGAPTSYNIQVEIANAKIAGLQNAAIKKAVSGTKQKLIDDGFDENTLNEIEDYLTANKFSGSEIQTIFESYKVYPDEVAFHIIKKPKTLFNDSFGALRICYAAFLNGYHLLLSGDKGTGKNCLITTWAWVLQRPLYSNSVNRETDKLDFLGSKTIDSEVDSASGHVMDKITFQPEVLLQAMEVGGVINIDEVNFAEPGITGLLHSIADDRREIQVPGYKKVAADDNFFIMGTMNIDYQGTNELNEALADRFIDICFPPNESIANILNANCPKSPQSEIQICDNIYKQMYTTIQARDSSLDSNCLTVRGFIQALNMSAILGLKTALRVCVADKIKDEEYRNNTWQIIDSKCR